MDDTLFIRIPVDSHHFYDFSPYHVYAFKDIREVRRVELHEMDTNSMFQIYKMIRKGQLLGLAFRSANQVLNGGSYLISYMQKTKQKATNSVTLIRTPDIVVYNYPNVGTMAISPKVNTQMAALLEEQ